MGRVVVPQGSPSIRGGRNFTAALVELDDGTRVHVQLYDDGGGPRAKITRMKWRGLFPAETLLDDDSVLLRFSELGPQDLTPEGRTVELVRRLTELVVACRSISEVRALVEDLDAAGLYDNERWRDTVDLSRLRSDRPAVGPASKETSAFAETASDFSAAARRDGVVKDYIDVVADFGEHMERGSGQYHVRSASELPYPSEVIRAALVVALNDPRNGEATRQRLLAGIYDLENYLSDEELAPYQNVVARMAQLMGTISDPQYRRLVERDPTAALNAIAGIETDDARLDTLERLLRRRRSIRYTEIVKRFPDVFDSQQREAEFFRWMYVHGADMHQVVQNVLGSLGGHDRGQAGNIALEELRELEREAARYPEPPGADTRRRWEVHQSLAYHAQRFTHALILALDQGEQTAIAEANKDVSELLAVLEKLASGHRQLQQDVGMDRRSR